MMQRIVRMWMIIFIAVAVVEVLSSIVLLVMINTGVLGRPGPSPALAFIPLGAAVLTALAALLVWRVFRPSKASERAAMEEEIGRASVPIVVVYRRADGTEGSATCFEDSYAEQLDRIRDRGHTVLNVIR
jgi:membrane protein implicated in regulation of membrane protease activity